MSGHTPTPWEADGITKENGKKVYAGIYQVGNMRSAAICSAAYANAAFIVRAVNSHDELVAALNCFLMDERFQVGVGGNPNAVSKMLAAAHAALAKAKEQ